MFERFATLAARLRAAAKPVAAANALSASHLGPARNPTRAPHRPQPTGSDTMDPGPHSRPLRPSARVVPQSDLRTRFSSRSCDCDASCPCRPLTSRVFGSPPGGRLSGAVGPRRVAAKFLTRVFVCPGEGLPGPSTATLSLAQAPATKAEAEQLALVLETACRLTALAAPPLARSRERRPGPPTAHS